MSDSFFIEPWQVEVTPDTLTLRDATTVGNSVLGGIVAWSSSLIAAAVDYWLWQRGTIEGFVAAWLGLVSALLAAKGIDQLWLAWRLRTNGPRCLTLRRDDRSVELNGFRGRSNGRVERVVIEVKVCHQKRATRDGDATRHEYTALLVVDGQRLELGTFGAESAADRLAEAISGFSGVPVTRGSQFA
jgi:hypothetical protein